MHEPLESELLKGEGAETASLLRLFRIRTQLEANAGKHTLGLSAAEMLLTVSANDNESVSQLAETLVYSPPKTSRCITRLLKFNLIEELPRSNDYRSCSIVMTRKGRNVAFELARPFGSEQVASMLRLSAQLRRALQSCASPEMPHLTETMQRILLVLGSNAAPQRIVDLCRMACLAQPKGSMSIKRMHDLGLLEITDDHDKRVRLVTLAERGALLSRAMLDMLREQ